jgi:Tol biopolymer transport system component
VTLAPSTRLGPYEIVGPLGAGGMGEVYRARDTKLNREVALKVLPEMFAVDYERVARFTREAQTLASLNHPNIAQIHGLADFPAEAGTHIGALVMELVDGEDLSALIARGPIPVTDALPIARQIADALEAAHELGIVHRDLKPANVKVRRDGTVKVLDFGLAKAMDLSAPDLKVGPTPAMNSPTFTSPATQLGVILGTAAYMAPEQAKGKAVDKRADIWAFGVVVFEMLTGRRAFKGDDTSDVLAAVLRQDIDWTALPTDTPPRMRRLLERCLERDPRTRLRDIGEARVEIAKIEGGDAGAAGARPADTWRGRLGWMTSAVLAAALSAAVWITWKDRDRNVAPARAMRLVFDPPPQIAFDAGLADAVVVSPDGRHVVFTGRSQDGKRQLFVQALDSADAKPLPGTEDPVTPFWSSDGRSIGFGSKGKLRRVEVAGGWPQVLANAPRLVGGSWNGDGTILFVPDFNSGVMQTSSTGADPKFITSIKPGEAGHRSPAFLPGGRRFSYIGGPTGERAVWLASLDNETPRRLTAGTEARYAPPGWLLLVQEGTLVAQAFDATRAVLTGDPLPVGGAGASESDIPLSVSDTGILVLKQAFTPEYQLSWFDREGKKLGDVGSPVRVALSISPRLSPDETRVVLQNREPANERRGIWVHDLARGISTRLSQRLGQYPQWSPDGSRVAWLTRDDAGTIGIYETRANGVGDQSLLLPIGPGAGGTTFPTDWSSDGRFILYYARSDKTRIDIWAMPLFGDRKPYLVLASDNDEHQGQLSADGHWLAYRSDGDGSYEIYIRSFTADGKVGSERRRISTGGGSQPRFRRDGRELFYLADDGWMMSVPLTSTAERFDAGAPKRLFKARMLTRGFEPQFEYDVTRDGQRFLIGNILDGPHGSPPRPLVVLNWAAEMKK